MIRKQQEKDIDEIINIWYKASGLAHPFLKTDFVEQEKKDLRDVYLPNAATWLYEDNHSVVGFISMLGNEIGGDYLYCRITLQRNWNKPFGRAFYEKYGFVQTKRYFHTESNSDMLRLYCKH